MTRIVKLLTIAFSVALITSCSDDRFCTEGNGDMRLETRSLPSFDRVVSNISANVTLIQEEDSRVEISASSNLHNLIETKVVGNTLIIDVQNGECIRTNYPINIEVSSASFSDVQLNDSGNIDNEGELKSYSIDLEVNGSGDLFLSQLNVTNYRVTIDGSGDVELRGDQAAHKGRLSIQGSGNINALNLETKEVDVHIMGSGNADVYATDQLNVNITGSGNVNYIGSPLVNSTITGSGVVKHK